MVKININESLSKQKKKILNLYTIIKNNYELLSITRYHLLIISFYLEKK